MDDGSVGRPHKHWSVVVDVYDGDDQVCGSPQWRTALVCGHHGQVEALRGLKLAPRLHQACVWIQGEGICRGGGDRADTQRLVEKSQTTLSSRANGTSVGAQHAVEHGAVLALVQVGRPHCDHRRAAALVLKHAGVVDSLREERPVVVDIEDCHQDLKHTHTGGVRMLPHTVLKVIT